MFNLRISFDSLFLFSKFRKYLLASLPHCTIESWLHLVSEVSCLSLVYFFQVPLWLYLDYCHQYIFLVVHCSDLFDHWDLWAHCSFFLSLMLFSIALVRIFIFDENGLGIFSLLGSWGIVKKTYCLKPQNRAKLLYKKKSEQVKDRQLITRLWPGRLAEKLQKIFWSSLTLRRKTRQWGETSKRCWTTKKERGEDSRRHLEKSHKKIFL